MPPLCIQLRQKPDDQAPNAAATAHTFFFSFCLEQHYKAQPQNQMTTSILLPILCFTLFSLHCPKQLTNFLRFPKRNFNSSCFYFVVCGEKNKLNRAQITSSSRCSRAADATKKTSPTAQKLNEHSTHIPTLSKAQRKQRNHLCGLLCCFIHLK